MNLNLINLHPKDWSKDDWRDAYAEYCKANIRGPKTKREYYDMVMENFRKMDERNKPISQELLDEWTRGRRAAKAWARKRGCDLNGRLLSDVRAEADDRTAREVADRAEDIAVDTMQRLDYLIDVAKKRRVS
ncbi:MAG: hypothetical protein J5588_09545 [Bacteroidales bacterium]|nr:hypothetical protein [Bacteroidales bacterium]